jgi:hypothetical protein
LDFEVFYKAVQFYAADHPLLLDTLLDSLPADLDSDRIGQSILLGGSLLAIEYETRIYRARAKETDAAHDAWLKKPRGKESRRVLALFKNKPDNSNTSSETCGDGAKETDELLGFEDGVETVDEEPVAVPSILRRVKRKVCNVVEVAVKKPCRRLKQALCFIEAVVDSYTGM